MTGIGGLLGRGRSPRDRQGLRCLGRFLNSMPDRVDTDNLGFEETTDVAMVHSTHAAAQGVSKRQPFIDSQGLLLTWDGHLDNAADLASELGMSSQSSTCEIVLQAYDRWGLDFPSRLIGDFAVALWDPHSRRLCLAVDALGSRSLYYHHDASSADGGRLIWATRARALVEAFDLPLNIDEDYVAAYLANGVSTSSPYQGVQQIPGAHLLVADDGGTTLHQYWSFDPENQIEYTRDHEYEEHFLELFRQAVACRLNTEGPIFAELSGGLDSSSIVCMAHDLMRRGEVPQREIETISFVFSESRTADEKGYIDAVERAVGKTGTYFDEGDHRILSKRLPQGFAPDLPTNQLSFLARYDAVAQHMKALGGRVILSGIGGDQALWSEALDGPVEVADLWVARRPIAALRRAYSWSRVLRAPLGRVIRAGLAHRSPIRGIMSREESPWLQTGFVQRTGLGSPPSATSASGFHQPSKARQHERILHTMRPFALQRCQSVGSVEVRYPFLDRRLLEFVLAVPLNQLIRPEETRSVLRRSLKNLLPKEILHRRTKAGPSESFQRSLIREKDWLSELFADPLTAQLGFVDRDAFNAALGLAQHGMLADAALMQSIVSLELWLRTLFAEDASSGAQLTSDSAMAPTSSLAQQAHARV